MKKIFFILSLVYLTSCTKSESTKPSPEEVVPEQVIEISNLINLSSGDLTLDEGNPLFVSSIDLSYTETVNALTKVIKLINNTASVKSLDIKVLNNPQMAVIINSCGTSLAANGACIFRVKHTLNNQVRNGIHNGLLNITQDQSAQAPIVSTINHPDRSPITTGTAADISYTFLNDRDFNDFTVGTLGHRMIKVTNNSLLNTVENIVLSFSNSKFSVLYSTCPAILNPKASCYIRVLYKEKNLTTPPAESELVLSAGSQSTSIRLVPQPIVSTFNLSGDKKVFTLTGSHFKFVKTVKILQGMTELENLVIDTQTDAQLTLKMSQNLNLQSHTEYTFRME